MMKYVQWIGLTVALLLVILLVVPLLIPADFLKAQLIAQVQKTTGRTLVIKGNTSLRLLPSLALSAEDVTLGNPAGFTSEYFVHIDKLQTGAALRPLLSKRLSITGVTLDGAVINLEEAANGAKNWEFTARKVKQEAVQSAAKTPTPAALTLGAFALGDVHLTHSTIRSIKGDAKPIAVSDINLTLSGADGASPLQLDGDVRYHGDVVKAQLGIGNITQFLQGQQTQLTAYLEVPNGRLRFAGTGALGDAMVVEGKLEVNSAALPALMNGATGIPPATRLPKRIALETVITVQGMQSVALDDLALDIDGAKASGKLAANFDGTVPAIQGALHVAPLDLDTFAAPVTMPAPTDNAPAPAAAGWSNTPMDLSGLRLANGNLDLVLDSVHSGALAMDAAHANLLLNNGVLKLTLGNAVLYGGAAKGMVSVDASGAAPAVAVEMALANIQIEPLVTALSGTSRLKGTANVKFSLNTSGASQRAMVGALAGDGWRGVANGEIIGMNLAQFLRHAKQGFLFDATTGKSTDFSALTANFTITQGVVTNNDLAMKSPGLRVAGSGTVNLPARSLTYKLVPTLAVTSEGHGGDDDRGGIAVPLLISGAWSNPQVVPDVAGMLQSGLKNPAALKQHLKDIKSTLKNFNSPKDL